VGGGVKMRKASGWRKGAQIKRDSCARAQKYFVRFLFASFFDFVRVRAKVGCFASCAAVGSWRELPLDVAAGR
jgi:hypothetical protein